MIHGNTSISNYDIIELLAVGGFSNVYLGKHMLLSDRIVAIKVLHEQYLDSQQERDRFLQEARLLEQLKHPYILPIIDAGIDGDLLYIVSEYMPNGSLQDRLDRYHTALLPIHESIRILSQIGQALHFAHQHNIIHRDAKPANILFNTNDDPIIADFGLAAELNTAGVRRTATIIGSPQYMAPEQFQGETSKQSDQYTLGCIAYRLFTGQVPFSGSDFWTLMHKHTNEIPIAPGRLNPRLPSHIEEAILRAMEKQAVNRYTSIPAFLMALERSTSPKNVPGGQQHSKEFWLEEGNVYYQQKHYRAAFAAYCQALNLDPTFAAAHCGKGSALYNLKHYEAALASYCQAIQFDSSSALAYCGKANSLYALERATEALAAYKQAIKLNPKCAYAHYGKGNVLFALQLYKEALTAYEQTIRLNSGCARAYYNKGVTLERLGIQEKARQAYEEARLLGYKA